MSEIATAYDASSTAWRTGPERVYERLAEALLAPEPGLEGARVLDVGAGTGVAGRVARRHGAALVVALDIAGGMLGQRDAGTPAVVGDAQRLPFGAGCFDLVVAAFSLGHLPDPAAAVVEARRVAPVLAASAFDSSWGHPAKAAVDEAMAAFGFRVPGWYVALQEHENLVEDPDALAELAETAGYAEVEVVRVDVETGLSDPTAMVDWRWGMAHLAPFVATLASDVRDRARAAALAAVVGLPPVVVPMLVLRAS